MTAVKKMEDRNIIEITEIAELRDYYHAVDLNETFMAISALKRIATVDASRELIQLYDDCVWRKIKIEIIQALGFHANQRSLEFLFEIAKSDFDLSLSYLAIESLAQTQHVLAVRFLENLYQYGHKTKKMSLVLALVKLSNTNCLDLFLDDLTPALENKEFPLAKNLIYALGEFRSHLALSSLKSIMSGPYPKDIQLSAVTSIGKISRDPLDLAPHAVRFRQDAFEFQIFQQAQNQISFRADWKLEDYLNKLFQSPNYHKNLPLELNAFSAPDVFAGIEMFFEPKTSQRVADTLAFLKFKEVHQWYQIFFRKEDALQISQSISSQFSDECLPLIQQLSEVNLDLAQRAAVTCLPKADSYFKNFMMTENYKSGSDLLKIKTLNCVVDFLSIQHDVKIITSMAKFLENELQVESSVEVRKRLIRVFAQGRLPQNKIFPTFKSLLSQATYTQSILFYLEHHPSHQSATFLKDNFSFFESLPQALTLFLKALTAQEPESFNYLEIKKLMQNCINSSDSNHQVQVLKFMAKNPQKDFKPCLITALKDKNPQVILNAVIALKALNDDDIPDLLQPFLHSASESLRGRSLDAILHNSSLRAKRVAIDFMKDHFSNNDCSEKIIRELSKAEIKSDYFSNTVAALIKNNPQHPLIDSLQDLYTKLQENQSKNFPSGADLVAIDKEILRHLPQFAEYDENIKVSLRSAEVPFNKPELFDQFVDKSVCILGFTKAIDIFLEKHFGKKILLPKIESRLHEFQNLTYLTRLNEDHPDAQQLLTTLGLEKYFTSHSLPVHKMTLIGKGILSSKIVNEQFKILDGLRAWSITFLLFTRRFNPAMKPLVATSLSDAQCIDLAKKLMWLQDVRNPVAHRHTLTQLDELKEIRSESYRILNQLEKALM